MNLSVCVQHHPSRAQLLSLLDALGGFELVVDPEPDSPVKSALRTYIECLRRTPEDVTHRLVVQDDALPCDGFRELAEAAIEEKPDEPIAFFVPGRQMLRRMMETAHSRGKRWLLWPNYNWAPTVALCWPQPLIADFIAFAEDVIATRAAQGMTTQGDDPYTGEWAKARSVPIWCTVPCLVQHPDVELSIVRPDRKPRAGGNRARVAALFVGDLATSRAAL